MVDDFTHFNQSRTEALELCRREPGIGALESEAKVKSAEEAGEARWFECLDDLRTLGKRASVRRANQQEIVGMNPC